MTAIRLLSVSQAAEELNRDAIAVKRLIARGRLAATRLGDTKEWRIDADHLVDYVTPLKRYILNAGILPWQKPWQNMRSNRETELLETYPIHVVCAWIGNTPKVAAEHYLQVTDDQQPTQRTHK
jgi:excisionase family DNA binding protein